MRTRLLLLFFTIQMPISGFAQKAVSAGFGSFQTNCSNQGAYLRLGIDVFDNLELIYTYKGSFGQKLECLGDAGTKVSTQFTLGNQLGLVQYNPSRRYYAGFSFNRDRAVCSEVTKTFNDAWDYQWNIWSRNQGIWRDPNAPLVRLSDFDKLQTLMNHGHSTVTTKLNFGIMGGVNITKHWRFEANYVLIDLNAPATDSRHLSSIGLRYRWFID